MIRLKHFLNVCVIFFVFPVQAEWGLVTGTGSYMGSYYLGANYRSDLRKHTVDLTAGVSPGIIDEEVYQLNLKYLYSPFEYYFQKFSSNIVGIGLMVARCLCKEVFVENLSIYPESNYYDETAFRFGLVFSTIIRLSNLELFWDFVFLDQIAIANYNNPSLRRHPFDYWSGGFGVRIYDF